MRSFRKEHANAILYVFDIEPVSPDTAARITIKECGASGYHVRLESIARAYTHMGFVGSPEQEEHADSYAKAVRLAVEFTDVYATTRGKS